MLRMRFFLPLLVLIVLAGCSSESPSFTDSGKADDPNSIAYNPGPGCSTVANARYNHLVLRFHSQLGLAAAPDGTLELGNLSGAARKTFSAELSSLVETLEASGASYPEDIKPLIAGGDLAQYFAVRTSELTHEQVQRLCNELVLNGLSELVYPAPAPMNALADEGIDLREGVQINDYLASSELGGFGLTAVRSVPGGTGTDIRVCDVETGVTLDHEDFPEVELVAGVINSGSPDHGTAVLGVIGAQDNGFGSVGMAPDATLGFASYSDPSDPREWGDIVASTIIKAGDWAGPNGIVLIEIHAPAPVRASRCDSQCNPGQCNYVAMEYWPAIYDSIRLITDRGVHVVEAAGNGEVDLDRLLPDRRVFDSGAVIVGASLSNQRSPACFSNFGKAVDVHGWGENVLTTGYGNHPIHETIDNRDPRKTYTASFSGTSSASPMVVGSMASILGMVKAQGQVLLPSDLRDLLIRTGNQQTSAAPPNRSDEFRLIGPQPDVDLAWHEFQRVVPTASFELIQQDQGRVSFEDRSVLRPHPDGQLLRKEWDFGDGSTSSSFDSVVTHEYPGPGEYTVTLRLVTLQGYSRTAASTVKVKGAVSAEAAVLELVNTADFDTLDNEVGLDRRAAKNIIAFRPFDSIEQLTSVPFVKEAALTMLYQFVEN